MRRPLTFPSTSRLAPSLTPGTGLGVEKFMSLPKKLRAKLFAAIMLCGNTGSRAVGAFYALEERFLDHVELPQPLLVHHCWQALPRRQLTHIHSTNANQRYPK